MNNRIKYFLLFTLSAIIFSCSSSSSTKKLDDNQKPANRVTKSKNKNIQVKLSVDKASGTLGESFKISYESNIKPTPDSIKLNLNKSLANKIKAVNHQIIWTANKAKTGTNYLLFHFFWSDTLSATQSLKIILKSDTKPEKYTYHVINTFNHSYKNYTQGLEFNNGYLYEGTGQYGESMLFKTNIDANETLQSIHLPDNVFGEGITLLDDKIYQLTWRSSIGFVYDKNSFKKLYDFNYPTEGWGLTNNGKELIMSDGSENIYFLDTEFMQQIRKLEVYDHQGPVKDLNELEYINGLIYANIYGSDKIVCIDTQTGKVIKSIDLSGILDKKNVKHPIDVLNGIAWDKTKNRLIVTGKWWPKLFEIELVKK